MSTLIAQLQALQALLPQLDNLLATDQAYLSRAADTSDLERRLRQIDDRADTLATGLRLGQVLA